MECGKTNAKDHTCSLLDVQLDRPPPIWFSKRLLVAVLLSLGYFFYAVCSQVLNIAIVDMTSNKTLVIGNRTITQAPEFDWNLDMFGSISNALWYGFLFSFFGGHLSQKFGGSTTIGVSIMMMGTILMLQPFCARFNFHLFLVSQVLMGLFGSFFLSNTTEIYAKWLPLRERMTFTFHIVNGMYIGIALTFPVCGVLAKTWGWSMPLYTTGIACLTWSVVWLILVKNSPDEDQSISQDELVYILRETVQVSKETTTLPYKEILKSVPSWAVSISKFAFNWGLIITGNYLPLYMRDATQKNVGEVGLISGIPGIVVIFAIPLARTVLNSFQENCNFSISQIHKLVIFCNFILAGISLVIIVCIDHFIVAVICFVVVRFLLSYNRALTEMIIVNMAPNHSSLLSGLTMIWFTVGAILAQDVIVLIVKNHKLEEWNTCFIISTGIFMLSGFIFMAFGSSKPQPWSLSKESGENEDECVQNIELLK